MIQLKDLCLSFGSQKIFDHVNESIAQDQRLGLVGRNGSGKSTLLKAIAGMQSLDTGTIAISGGMRFAYMPQEVVLASNRSILEEALLSYKDVGPLKEQEKALLPLVTHGDVDALEEYAQVVQRLAELNSDYAEAETKKMLLGLGFKQSVLQDPVSSLSVGWQMRVVLAKLLLQQADFYLFDEPTNHLDIVAKDWFLQFLKDASFGFMLVCHDKYFLDELCTTILELDRGQGTLYYGNYTRYEDEKQQRLETLQQAYAQQQKEIAHKKRTIERFRAKSSKAKMAKSMEKSLDKIELIEIPPDPRKALFSFPPVQRSGKVVLDVQDVGFSFAEKKIFDRISFSIERGEKVALVAPNGMGKTTLFNVVSGKYPLQKGAVHMGHNVEAALFEQDQTKVLDPKKNLLEEVLSNVAKKTEQQIRTFLGAFLFGKEEIIKKTAVLSGGERNRLSMVKVLLQDANFLLLDEPTNHLDIDSKEILLRALQQYEGTLFFVSHDHDFVNHLATRIIELTPQGVKSYFGNYDSFLQQKAFAQEQSETPKKETSVNNTSIAQPQTVKSSQLQDIAAQKEVKKLERSIEKVEKELENINQKFADYEYGTDAFEKNRQKYQEKEAHLALLLQEWEKIIDNF